MNDMPEELWIDTQDQTFQAHPFDGPHMQRYIRDDLPRELLATWMLRRYIPTGHGDTMADLLAELDAWLKDVRTKCNAAAIEASQQTTRAGLAELERDRYRAALEEIERNTTHSSGWSRDTARRALEGKGDE